MDIKNRYKQARANDLFSEVSKPVGDHELIVCCYHELRLIFLPVIQNI